MTERGGVSWFRADPYALLIFCFEVITQKIWKEDQQHT